MGDQYTFLWKHLLDYCCFRTSTIKEPVFLLRHQFLAGNEMLFGFQDPGFPFAIFKPYLPPRGNVSFITDAPDNSKNMATEQLQAAQSYLAPLLLNHNPVETTALAFCSQNEIAVARMQAAGYRITRVLENGKMIAEKKS